MSIYVLSWLQHVFIVTPVILWGGGEEGYDEDEGDGGEGEVEGVAASVSPRTSSFSRLHHHTVSVL